MNDAGTNAPPPSPPVSVRAGNDWERRDELGFVSGLVGAVKQFVTAPSEAFAQTRRSGDLASPILFTIILSVAASFVGQLWGLLLGSSLLAVMPVELQESVGWLMVSSGAGFFVGLIMVPIFTVIWLFLWSAIVHVLLLLVGGMETSEAGFEGSLRCVAYSSVGNLGRLVPFIGEVISALWMIVLMVIGLTKLHGTSEGKAVAVVLLPMVLCCVCVALLMIVGVGAVMSGLGG